MLTTIFLSFLENVIGWTSTRNIDYSFIFEWKDTLIFAEKYNFICPGGVKKDQNHPGFEYSLGRSRNTPTKKVQLLKLPMANCWKKLLGYLSCVLGKIWGWEQFLGQGRVKVVLYVLFGLVDLLVKRGRTISQSSEMWQLGWEQYPPTDSLTDRAARGCYKKSFADEGNLWIILQPKCCRLESFRLSQIRAHRCWQLSHHLHEIFNAI